MAAHVTTTVHLTDAAQLGVARQGRWVSTPEDHGLGALRGLAFAVLIEAATALFAGVGWELWRMIR
jgi:hypothetical protein